METQVVIIGAGIMGTAIAREISRYEVDAVLVERHPDVCSGVSKASNGMIYSGLKWLTSVALKAIVAGDGSAESHMQKDKLCLDGYHKWEQILQELDVPYLPTGDVVIARNDEEMERLKRMQEMARPEWNIRLLDRDTLFSMEPNVTPDAVGALYDEDHVLSQYPWEVVIALAENARDNGIKVMLNTAVQGFSQKNGYQIVETTKGPIRTDFIINACGPWATEVAQLADSCNFSLQFFRGHSLLTDRRVGSLITNCISWPPTPGVSKSIQPMVNGNLRLGSIYTSVENKNDVATVEEDMETVFQRASDLVPALSKDDIIAYYAGIRVFSARDREEYIIEFAPNNPRFMNVVLRLPGFTPAPAIAENVVNMLAEAGLELSEKGNFNPYRSKIPIFRELSDDERRPYIARDPRWGHIVCRCETVTAAEILAAIQRGATTLDGIKYRTRAGMGRCQTNFCGLQTAEILARELNVPIDRVTKNGGYSKYLV